MTISIANAIRAKLQSIAPDATAVAIAATLYDIRQSCYWSADISLARLATIYNGAAGLVNQEQTELLLNALEDIDCLMYEQQTALAARLLAVEEVERCQQANTVAPLAREDELAQDVEGDYYGELTHLACYLCVAPEHRMEEQPDHRWPIRAIVRTQTAGRADPTESYTLECGHTII